MQAYSHINKNSLEQSELAAIGYGKKLSRMIDVAARYGPYRAKCLCRSLVLIRLLRRRNLAGDLTLGAQLKDEKFGAHAWVSLYGQVVNDRSDVASTFSQFEGNGKMKE